MTRLANCRRLHGVACTVLRGVLIFASVVAAADGNVALYTSAIDRSAGPAGILVVPDTAKDLDAVAAGARKAGRKFYVAFAVNEIF